MPPRPVVPDPVSAVIAARVRELRKGRGWHQVDLAEKMKAEGHDWTRNTVFKLEDGGRASLSVGEWLSLGEVLGLPAMWLLSDPQRSDLVPLGPKTSADAWTAYYWIAGLEPPGVIPVTWSRASDVLWLGVEHLVICRQIDEGPPSPRRRRRSDVEQASLDELHRERFRALIDVRQELVLRGAAPPEVHFRVADRAAELGIDLTVPDPPAGEG